MKRKVLAGNRVVQAGLDYLLQIHLHLRSETDAEEFGQPQINLPILDWPFIRWRAKHCLSPPSVLLGQCGLASQTWHVIRWYNNKFTTQEFLIIIANVVFTFPYPHRTRSYVWLCGDVDYTRKKLEKQFIFSGSLKLHYEILKVPNHRLIKFFVVAIFIHVLSTHYLFGWRLFIDNETRVAQLWRVQ